MFINEIYSESECSETEDVQSSIITDLTNMFDINYEEPDRNRLFLALNRGCFEYPDY